MWSLISRLFRCCKALHCEPRPRPPRYRARRDAATARALLDVVGWRPPTAVEEEALVRRRPR
jgi:hypothetical protein